MSNYIKEQLSQLFEQAQINGGIQYIYTLVRVSGFGEGEDKLITLKTRIEKFEGNVTGIELFSILRAITQNDDMFSLLINLISCASKGFYDSHPFIALYKGEGFRSVKPASCEIIREISNKSKRIGETKLSQLIDAVFCSDVLNYLETGFSEAIALKLEKRLDEILNFVKVFLELYFDMRLKYKNSRKIYKCPGFVVLELLTDDDYGLNGFNIYFSNGSSAQFIRSRDNTICMNICSTNPVDFQRGFIDNLKNEFRIGEKRLFEVGLEGRYNKLGEWKPIFYPVSTENFQNEVLALSDDEDIQGAYFYMLCTGHKVIEFVVRTTIELPSEFINFGHSFHLWKCPVSNSSKSSNVSLQIYDGWVDLKDGSVEEIETALKSIGLAINIVGFTYGVAIDWRIKYKIREQSEAIAMPAEEDLDLLNTLLQTMPYSGNEAKVLCYALDWYVRGRTSKNICIRFLSYYITLEIVASAVIEGDAEFGFKVDHETREERIEGIKKKYDDLFKIDPIRFVRESYFDFVVGLKRRTRKVTENVFGIGNKYVSLLFDKTESGEPSLCDIRGRLAHGSIALFDREDEMLVRRRLHEIENISWEFLMRIILGLKDSDSLPSWSGNHKAEIVTVDPRSTLSYNTETIFPEGTDWKIKSEWFD